MTATPRAAHVHVPLGAHVALTGPLATAPSNSRTARVLVLDLNVHVLDPRAGLEDGGRAGRRGVPNNDEVTNRVMVPPEVSW